MEEKADVEEAVDKEDKISFLVEDIHAKAEVMCCDEEAKAVITIEATADLKDAIKLLSMFPAFHTAELTLIKKRPYWINRENL